MPSTRLRGLPGWPERRDRQRVAGELRPQGVQPLTSDSYPVAASDSNGITSATSDFAIVTIGPPNSMFTFAPMDDVYGDATSPDTNYGSTVRPSSWWSARRHQGRSRCYAERVPQSPQSPSRGPRGIHPIVSSRLHRRSSWLLSGLADGQGVLPPPEREPAIALRPTLGYALGSASETGS